MPEVAQPNLAPVAVAARVPLAHDLMHRLSVTSISGRAFFLVTQARVISGINAALADALGYPAPANPRQCTTSRSGNGFCLWHSPYQWLIGTDAMNRRELMTALVRAVEGKTVSVFDVTGGFEGLRIAGADAARLLSKGTLLDLRDKAFPPGTGTRTLFAHHSAIIVRDVSESAYDIYYDGSLGHAVRLWFAQAVVRPEIMTSP